MSRSLLGDSNLDDAVGRKAAWEKAELCGLRPKWSLRGRRHLRIVDLFSGVGGLSIGVSSAAKALGLRPELLLAADANKSSLEVYKRNLRPAHIFPENLFQVVDGQVSRRPGGPRFIEPPTFTQKTLEQLVGKVDLVLAGPPCQGHSNLNNKTRRSDSRNILYHVPVSAAIALRAPLLIIENVVEVKADKTDVVGTAKDLLKQEGYSVWEGVVRGELVGVPQTRRRHILVASRVNEVRGDEVYASLTTLERTAEWAIEDLLEAENSSHFDSSAELSAENQERIRYLFDANAYDLPNQHRPECHRDGHTYPSVYGRMHWDRPAQTITTGFLSPGRGRYVHPIRPRGLTPHEGARLQGFPDWFDFVGGQDRSRKDLSRWIGDAVPPMIGYVAGIMALDAFD